MCSSRGALGGSERQTFRLRLAQGILLGDGAYGTALSALAGEGLVERLNLDDPRAVEALHLEYLRAGAEMLQTNTYAANRLQLAAYGLSEKVYELNVQGAKIARGAREIAGEAALVAGSIGPLGVSSRGTDTLPAQEALAAYREQIDALLAGGVDLLLIETQADPHEAALALSAARSACDLPVVLNFSFAEGDRTLSGHTVEDVVALLQRTEDPPDLFGVNCSLGPSHALRLLAQLRAAGLDGPFAVAPNAGPPMRVGGQIDYLGTPERYAALLGELKEHGARVLGGCCGTDPAYIAALRRARDLLTEVPATARSARIGAPFLRSRAQAVQGKPAEQGVAPPVGLRGKLGQEFLIGVELDPPRGSVVSKLLDDGASVREAGADFVNVGDSPMARVRMGALGASYLLQQAGIESILHLTTRDRNRRALEADLLSAHALGVRNVLAVTGDRPRGPTGGVGVFEVDAIGLLQVMRRLNTGSDLEGGAVGAPTDFTAGCAFDPGRQDLDEEVRRLRQKQEAGARFAMTQPVYRFEIFERALERLRDIDIPLILGVMPLYSHRHAVFLDREVPGISIPAALLDRMERAGEHGLELGLELAWEFIERAGPRIHGVYVVPSFGRVQPIAELVHRLRKGMESQGREDVVIEEAER